MNCQILLLWTRRVRSHRCCDRRRRCVESNKRSVCIKNIRRISWWSLLFWQIRIFHGTQSLRNDRLLLGTIEKVERSQQRTNEECVCFFMLYLPATHAGFLGKRKDTLTLHYYFPSVLFEQSQHFSCFSCIGVWAKQWYLIPFVINISCWIVVDADSIRELETSTHSC